MQVKHDTGWAVLIETETLLNIGRGVHCMKAVAESNELNPMATPSRWQKYLNEGYISSIGLLLRGIESFQHCIIQFILGHRSAGKWPSTPSIFLSTWDKSISWRLSKPRMVVAAETGLVGNPLSLRPQNSRISGSPSSSLVPRILKTSIFGLCDWKNNSISSKRVKHTRAPTC